MPKYILAVFYASVLNGTPTVSLVSPSYRLGVPAFFSQTIGWASGSGGSIWRTVDGGKVWSKVKSPVGSSDANGVYFVSADEAWVRASSEPLVNGSRLFQTRDGGISWHKEVEGVEWTGESLFSLQRSGLLFLGGTRSKSGLWPSSNQCPQGVRDVTVSPSLTIRRAPGRPFESPVLPVENGCPVSLISFADESRGVAVAGYTIMFTSDGGRHWKQSVVADANSLSRPASVQFNGLEVWSGCEGGEILHSTDGGSHWQIRSPRGTLWTKSVGFGLWGQLWFTAPAEAFTIGGNGALFWTTDGARTWQRVMTPERITAISCAAKQCWLMGKESLYLLSTEPGANPGLP